MLVSEWPVNLGGWLVAKVSAHSCLVAVHPDSEVVCMSWAFVKLNLHEDGVGWGGVEYVHMG